MRKYCRYYEKVEFDEDGNISNANFVDFVIPYATEIPKVEMYHLETPAPLNPLGVKGVGEAGCIATAATIASGLTDALKEFDNPKFRSTPITPSMVHEVINSGDIG